MNKTPLPLESVIEPSKISFWPLAPIWWIVIGLFIVILLTVICYKRYQKRSLASQRTKTNVAILELDSYQKPNQEGAEEWLQKINLLLKRICAVDYPLEQTHLLVGKEWLSFLEQKCPQAHLSHYDALVDGTYQKSFHLDDETIDSLYQSVKYWIINHV